MLDRVGDMLMDRASRTDVREEQQLYLDARGAAQGERAALMAEFEQRLRARDRRPDRRAGASPRPDFAKVDATKLTLVDTTAMDESVVTGNITRVVENLCHDELQCSTAASATCSASPTSRPTRNPLGAGDDRRRVRRRARQRQEPSSRIKFQILKELNQAPLGEIAPSTPTSTGTCEPARRARGARAAIVNRGGGVASARRGDDAREAREPRRQHGAGAGSRRDGAVPAHVRQRAPTRRAGDAGATPVMQAMPRQAGAAEAGAGVRPTGGDGDLPADRDARRQCAALDPVRGRWRRRRRATCPARRSSPRRSCGEGLTRLQAGEIGLRRRRRRGRSSPAFRRACTTSCATCRSRRSAQKANQLESMTIEMVAMLFDFIFETRTCPTASRRCSRGCRSRC